MFKNLESVQSSRTCPANLGVRSCPVRKLICPVQLSPNLIRIVLDYTFYQFCCQYPLIIYPVADDKYHIDKWKFTVPFVCGAKNLGEALRRIAEGAAMIRTKGKAVEGLGTL